MTGRHGLTRRRLLASGIGLGAVAATPVLFGCSSREPIEPDAAKGSEAPGLAERVDAGELPPVGQRLPTQPLVVEPVDRVGAYGGIWRSVIGRTEYSYLYAMLGYENLVSWTPGWSGAVGTSEITPNVAESYEISDDGTEFTFRLREGMKWSDGEPFTAGDVQFAVEDVMFDTELFPSPGKSVLSRGNPIEFRPIDELSFTLVTAQPDGLFLHLLAHPLGQVYTKFPRHYLERFHPRYNPDAKQLAADEGFENWVDYFEKLSGLVWFTGQNADIPTLWPWHFVTTLDSRQVKLERNPYYWKVDPDGSQLPYIDEVTYDVLDDAEAMLSKALNGEVSMEAGPDTRFTNPANKPLLAKEREEHDFDFVEVTETRMNIMCVYLNLTHKDPAKREMFNNLDFRIGLSHAINRQDIIDATMQRQGEPYQAAPLPDSAFYDEEFATQYLEYDVDLANDHLDAAYPDKNADGVRLGPDGEPISFVVEFVPDMRPEWAEQLEMIRRFWREVGVDVAVRDMDDVLFAERKDNNEHDACVWHGDGGLDVLQQPKNYVVQDAGSYYAVPWGMWNSTGGAEGEEPPENTLRQLQLLKDISASTDPAEQQRLATEMLTIAKEQFHVIGIARETAKYFIAKNDFRNVPQRMIQGWTYPTPGPTRPEQYYIG
ncbi:ABC transporter substrate-binding protein [Phytoactinopolyspora halotolerans]|uniref:ABC transporter substrate-binding protein n=1 Tax=Phytoactinopolyspora halotolerans TaxID=1981512 RepID=A0A6L9SJD1_9ACTN|nr:ABC transporter substrate-binding protein [Phytoactinopolyspora halotolerans]NEE04401.1 ABC transporter substrate-binding protein [Phytoactinopolyspora halotolerans]